MFDREAKGMLYIYFELYHTLISLLKTAIGIRLLLLSFLSQFIFIGFGILSTFVEAAKLILSLTINPVSGSSLFCHNCSFCELQYGVFDISIKIKGVFSSTLLFFFEDFKIILFIICKFYYINVYNVKSRALAINLC